MGLALGDDETGIVSPLEVVSCGSVKAGARIIADTLSRVGAERAVIGLPARADGSTGPATLRTEYLAEAARSLGVDVDLQPEYLSTNEARRRAREIGRPTDRPVDDLAAQIILEDYLAQRSPIARAKD